MCALSDARQHLDTRKRYARRVRAELSRELPAQQYSLIDAFDPAAVNAERALGIQRALRALGLEPDDEELLWGTLLAGHTLPEYLRAHGVNTCERTRNRLWRRRQRLRARVQRAICAEAGCRF